MADVKKLVFSIIRFLQDQRTSNTLEEEQSESLEGIAVYSLLETFVRKKLMKYLYVRKCIETKCRKSIAYYAISCLNIGYCEQFSDFFL